MNINEQLLIELKRICETHENELDREELANKLIVIQQIILNSTNCELKKARDVINKDFLKNYKRHDFWQMPKLTQKENQKYQDNLFDDNI